MLLHSGVGTVASPSGPHLMRGSPSTSYPAGQKASVPHVTLVTARRPEESVRCVRQVITSEKKQKIKVVRIEG